MCVCVCVGGGGVGGNSQVLCCLASVLSGVCMKLQSTPKCLFVFVVWNLECVCVCVCVCLFVCGR